MSRQSISLTEPNNDWLKARVASNEYMSKSEVINDLIRRARELDAVRNHLAKAEASGLGEVDRGELLERIKGNARKHGEL